jgi:hypothetical protein
MFIKIHTGFSLLIVRLSRHEYDGPGHLDVLGHDPIGVDGTCEREPEQFFFLNLKLRLQMLT